MKTLYFPNVYIKCIAIAHVVKFFEIVPKQGLHNVTLETHLSKGKIDTYYIVTVVFNEATMEYSLLEPLEECSTPTREDLVNSMIRVNTLLRENNFYATIKCSFDKKYEFTKLIS